MAGVFSTCEKGWSSDEKDREDCFSDKLGASVFLCGSALSKAHCDLLCKSREESGKNGLFVELLDELKNVCIFSDLKDRRTNHRSL
jgi:hypothetical protein